MTTDSSNPKPEILSIACTAVVQGDKIDVRIDAYYGHPASTIRVEAFHGVIDINELNGVGRADQLRFSMRDALILARENIRG